MLKKILAILSAVGAFFSALFFVLFKKENEEKKAITEKYDNMSKNLDALAEGEKAQRFWKESDIWRLRDFAEHFPRGRSGVMGSVTQRYQPYDLQKQRRKKHGKKSSRSRKQ